MASTFLGDRQLANDRHILVNDRIIDMLNYCYKPLLWHFISKLPCVNASSIYLIFNPKFLFFFLPNNSLLTPKFYFFFPSFLHAMAISCLFLYPFNPHHKDFSSVYVFWDTVFLKHTIIIAMIIPSLQGSKDHLERFAQI